MSTHWHTQWKQQHILCCSFWSCQKRKNGKKNLLKWSRAYLSSTHNLRASQPGSSVSIVTGYSLDVPGIESRWGEIFYACPDRPWGPPSLLYNGYRVFPRGKERPGRDADPSPPSNAVGHRKAELYLYSPYWLYSLYTASVPVQGCTLPLPLMLYNLHTW
jgi:hypothetical protein